MNDDVIDLFPPEVNNLSWKAQQFLFFAEAQEKNLSGTARSLYLCLAALDKNKEFLSEMDFMEIEECTRWSRRTIMKYLNEIGSAKLTTIARRIGMIHTLN